MRWSLAYASAATCECRDIVVVKVVVIMLVMILEIPINNSNNIDSIDTYYRCFPDLGKVGFQALKPAEINLHERLRGASRVASRMPSIFGS